VFTYQNENIDLGFREQETYTYSELSSIKEASIMINWADAYSHSKIAGINKESKIIKLEDLTKNSESLAEYLFSIGIKRSDEQIRELQNTVVNKKNKVMTIEETINLWTDEELKRFYLICSDTMMQNNYSDTIEIIYNKIKDRL